MIDSLHGTLIAKEMNMAVVECGGVGYACRISYQTYSKLCAVGEEVFLYTILSVSMREGNLELYGFLSAQERRCFSMLTGVGSVGGKAALAILSELTPERLHWWLPLATARLFDQSQRRWNKNGTADCAGIEKTRLRKSRAVFCPQQISAEVVRRQKAKWQKHCRH